MSPHFANSLHGGVGESVVGLTGISASTAHAAPTDEVVQGVAADCAAHLVQHAGRCVWKCECVCGSVCVEV